MKKTWGIVSDNAGGCIIVGGSWFESYENAFVAHVNGEGELLTYTQSIISGGQSYAYEIVSIKDEGYLVSGRYRQNGNQNGNPIVVILDHSLVVSKIYNVEHSEESLVRSTLILENGDLMLVGQSQSEIGMSDILIGRINANGSSANLEANSNTSYTLFPNPFSDFTYLSIPLMEGQKTISVYDMSGKMVMETEFNSTEIIIYKNDFNPGLYIFKVVNEGTQGQLNGKFQVL